MYITEFQSKRAELRKDYIEAVEIGFKGTFEDWLIEHVSILANDLEKLVQKINEIELQIEEAEWGDDL